jgi:tRNA threonylcarbamoyladenosine biosynthesis protein TsaE
VGVRVDGPHESIWLPDEAATLTAGAELGSRLADRFAADHGPLSALVCLHGDLGAGKTTLVRGLLRGLGHTGSVKSPTYTLLEPYDLTSCVVYHFDFYRILEAQELDFIGIDELLEQAALKLIEWPERAGERLPPPDLDVYLSVEGVGRRLEIVWHR